MIYVFDTNSFSKLKHFYPDIFKSIWIGLDEMVNCNNLISTREVRNELNRGNPNKSISNWLKSNSHLFLTPTSDELMIVADIFKIKHFQTLIGEQQRLKGTPVADPFVIACAKSHNGTVVTEEIYKPNAAKIPNVCKHFDVPCISLEQFMKEQKWVF